MNDLLVRAPVLLGASLLLACSMLNPAFDDHDEVGGTDVGDGDGDDPDTGDGDGEPGDGDGEPSTGDGDGEPSTGDGDGEPSTGDGDGCEAGKDECNGACVDLQSEFNHCGQCGSPCKAGQLCGQGQCLDKKYVFVSTHLFTGGIIGLMGAQLTCTELASVAQLPGNYHPWISDSQESPLEYLGQTPGAYLLRNGPVIAYSWEQFLSGQHEAAINRNQFGELIPPTPTCGIEFAVWTGTSDFGEPTENNCYGWSSVNPGDKGVVGNAGTSGPGWSNACDTSCATPLPIYCVQD
jgi:hypothetical protein